MSDPSWCPECGPNVMVDEDGCCQMCGSTAMGPGATKAHDLAAKLAEAESERQAGADHRRAPYRFAKSSSGGRRFCIGSGPGWTPAFDIASIDSGGTYRSVGLV